MAMMKLSAEKCREILADFRRQLPDIPDDLLKELAGNYAFDAPMDIDPNEIGDLLAIPGPRLVLRKTFMEGCCIEKSFKSLFSDTTTGGVDLTTVAGVLLFIKINPKFSFQKILPAVNQYLTQILHPGASTKTSVYIDASLKTDCAVLVILSGIGTSHEVLAANAQIGTSEELSTSLELFELPAFLKQS